MRSPVPFHATEATRKDGDYSAPWGEQHLVLGGETFVPDMGLLTHMDRFLRAIYLSVTF